MRPETIEIVKATAPVLEPIAHQITARFYPLLFERHPGLRSLFNHANQRSGKQAHALAHAVVAFAQNVDRPEVLRGALERIAHKHVSVHVQPHQYEAVGACLLQAIAEVLGDAATDEILEAWGEAYGFLADLLIGLEQDIVHRNESKPGGWRGPRRFQVIRVVQESSTIRSFYLAPTDGGPLMSFVPGQYLTVLPSVGGRSVRRNYSLSCAPNGHYYRISIKREPLGVVSGFFHDQVRVGHTLDVLPPCGDLVLDDSDRPLVLVSAGVGITPAISMLDAAIESGRRILFLHAARSSTEHAFAEHVASLAERHPQLTHTFVYDRSQDGDMPHHVGRIDERFLSDHLAEVADDMELYFVGPPPFMQIVHDYAERLGMPASRIHFEFFGPHQQLAAPPPAAVEPRTGAPHARAA